MATKKPDTVPALDEQPVELAAEGCVFMWRVGDDGTTQRAEVNVDSGSVEVMASLGWSTEQPSSGG
jgi:hypothetical protein